MISLDAAILAWLALWSLSLIVASALARLASRAALRELVAKVRL